MLVFLDRSWRIFVGALMALQLMTEHLLVVFFEMTQFFCFAKLINSQHLAMYAKRVIIKESDTE